MQPNARKLVSEERANRIVCNVSAKGGRKVLRVRSTLCIMNSTPLDTTVELMGTTLEVPAWALTHVPLRLLSADFMVFHGTSKIRSVDVVKTALDDVFDVDASNGPKFLTDLQLSSKEHVQLFTKMDSVGGVQLNIQPPLIVKNLLPASLDVTLSSGTGDRCSQWSRTTLPGASCSVYEIGCASNCSTRGV